MIEKIETERLILRGLSPEDAPDLIRLHSVPENIAFIGKSTLSDAETREKIARHIMENEPAGIGLRAAILCDSGMMIGRAGLFLSNIDGVREIELAYLFDHDYWGIGLATEASRALIHDAFRNLGLRRIIAIIQSENMRSLRVAEKCGFRYERSLNDYKDFGMVKLFSATG